MSNFDSILLASNFQGISTMESGVGPKYRMVALDLDGTLLQPDHTVSNETVDYLRALHDKGLTIAIATGR